MSLIEAGAPARALLARGVAVALDRRATCRLERAPGGVALAWKDALARAEADRLGELRAPVALQAWPPLLTRLGVTDGVRIEGQARVPASAGLATDTALLVAIAAAALRALGQLADEARIAPALAALGADALDVWMALYGGLGQAGVDGPAEVVSDPAWVEQALMLADVGLPARSDVSPLAPSVEERELARELAAALAACDDLATPQLIARAWQAQRAIDPQAETPAAAGVLSVARALGGAGRPCGPRGGGLLLLWLPPDAHDAARTRLRIDGVRLHGCRVDVLGLECEARVS